MASSSGGIALRLEALEYPHRASFRADDDASLAQCVAWLENRKVRHYQQGAARAHLLGSSVQPGLPGVARYLVDLGCPHEWLDADAAETADTDTAKGGQAQARRRGVCVHWLLGHAISLVFEEEGAACNAAAAAHAGQRALADPAFAAAVARLAEVLGLPGGGVAGGGGGGAGGGEGVALQLQAVRAHVEAKLSARAVARARQQQAKPPAAGSGGKEGSGGGGGEAPFDRASFPLGFRTGHPMLDDAATVLKMLYVGQLRELQNNVNKIIVTAQEFTANPKTDARLGQVGRK